MVKGIYQFNVIDGKLTPRGNFLSSQQRNRAEAYLGLLRTGQVAKENFLSPLKTRPTALLEDLHLLLVFNVLSLSIPLFLAHLYQMTC